MTNFADLVTLLEQAGGITRCPAEGLTNAIRRLLTDTDTITRQTEAAYGALSIHSGATRRSVELVETLYR